jgi:hypothetical protein
MYTCFARAAAVPYPLFLFLRFSDTRARASEYYKAKFCYSSSEDLVHRLFVCIAGVADQLQTNFASDLRNILKCVFLMNSSQGTNEDESMEEAVVSQMELDMPSSNESLERQESVEEEELVEDNEPAEERSKFISN